MPSLYNPIQRIYLDYAAATPLMPSVRDKMLPFMNEYFGNPSAIHTEGQVARQAIDAARQQVATTLGIKPTGVLFTGSGTESNNLAIIGHVEYLYKNGRSYHDMEVITTRIEHPSLLVLIPELEARGVVVTFLPVGGDGMIDINTLPSLLSKKTVLVALAYANSEVGTIQPIKRLTRTVRSFERSNAVSILVHLDAAQAPLWLSCNLAQLDVDLLALDAGKCGGPKGVGILALRKPDVLSPILFGGGQERGKRPGTENVAGIVGAGEAIYQAGQNYTEYADVVGRVRDLALRAIVEKLPEAVVNGATGDNRLPNNINISLPGFDTEYAVVYLDAHGVAASTKSACAGAGSGMSHVVVEMSHDVSRAKSTVRLTLGPATKPNDVLKAVDLLRTYCDTMTVI
jgi:cysteine desulfurase